MFRTLTTITAVGALVFSLHTISSAQESNQYNVGDKMPDYQLGTSFEGQDFTGKKDTGSKCLILVQIYSKNGKWKYQVVFPGYALGILPFGIFDFENKTLLIDNRDKSGVNKPDGIIDEVTVSPSGRDAYTDHPYCNK